MLRNERILFERVLFATDLSPESIDALHYAVALARSYICIGASGAGFGQWALFASNTDRILRQAACPVFIARPLKPIANNKTKKWLPRLE
jgi:nucleotide-binding universal stress UspA family protein